MCDIKPLRMKESPTLRQQRKPIWNQASKKKRTSSINCNRYLSQTPWTAYWITIDAQKYLYIYLLLFRAPALSLSTGSEVSRGLSVWPGSRAPSPQISSVKKPNWRTSSSQVELNQCWCVVAMGSALPCWLWLCWYPLAWQVNVWKDFAQLQRNFCK